MAILAPPGTIERRYVTALALRALAPGAPLTVLALQDKPSLVDTPARKPKLPPGKAQVAAAIARIQKQGYEAVPSDLIRGVTNLSYPVLDFSEQSAASLTIPFLQWDGDGHCDRETTRRRLGQAAQAISSAIGLLDA